MKVYRCTRHDADLGALLSWHTRKETALRYLLHHQRERGAAAMGPEGVDSLDIPTTRTGLVAWLNDHFTTDNG